jgi:hypothetical protein
MTGVSTMPKNRFKQLSSQDLEVSLPRHFRKLAGVKNIVKTFRELRERDEKFHFIYQKLKEIEPSSEIDRLFSYFSTLYQSLYTVGACRDGGGYKFNLLHEVKKHHSSSENFLATHSDVKEQVQLQKHWHDMWQGRSVDKEEFIAAIRQHCYINLLIAFYGEVHMRCDDILKDKISSKYFLDSVKLNQEIGAFEQIEREYSENRELRLSELNKRYPSFTELHHDYKRYSQVLAQHDQWIDILLSKLMVVRRSHEQQAQLSGVSFSTLPIADNLAENLSTALETQLHGQSTVGRDKSTNLFMKYVTPGSERSKQKSGLSSFITDFTNFLTHEPEDWTYSPCTLVNVKRDQQNVKRGQETHQLGELSLSAGEYTLQQYIRAYYFIENIKSDCSLDEISHILDLMYSYCNGGLLPAAELNECNAIEDYINYIDRRFFSDPTARIEFIDLNHRMSDNKRKNAIYPFLAKRYSVEEFHFVYLMKQMHSDLRGFQYLEDALAWTQGIRLLVDTLKIQESTHLPDISHILQSTAVKPILMMLISQGIFYNIDAKGDNFGVKLLTEVNNELCRITGFDVADTEDNLVRGGTKSVFWDDMRQWLNHKKPCREVINVIRLFQSLQIKPLKDFLYFLLEDWKEKYDRYNHLQELVKSFSVGTADLSAHYDVLIERISHMSYREHHVFIENISIEGALQRCEQSLQQALDAGNDVSDLFTHNDLLIALKTKNWREYTQLLTSSEKPIIYAHFRALMDDNLSVLRELIFGEMEQKQFKKDVLYLEDKMRKDYDPNFSLDKVDMQDKVAKIKIHELRDIVLLLESLDKPCLRQFDKLREVSEDTVTRYLLLLEEYCAKERINSAELINKLVSPPKTVTNDGRTKRKSIFNVYRLNPKNQLALLDNFTEQLVIREQDISSFMEITPSQFLIAALYMLNTKHYDFMQWLKDLSSYPDYKEICTHSTDFIGYPLKIKPILLVRLFDGINRAQDLLRRPEIKTVSDFFDQYVPIIAEAHTWTRHNVKSAPWDRFVELRDCSLQELGGRRFNQEYLEALQSHLVYSDTPCCEADRELLKTYCSNLDEDTVSKMFTDMDIPSLTKFIINKVVNKFISTMKEDERLLTWLHLNDILVMDRAPRATRTPRARYEGNANRAEQSSDEGEILLPVLSDESDIQAATERVDANLISSTITRADIEPVRLDGDDTSRIVFLSAMENFIQNNQSLLLIPLSCAREMVGYVVIVRDNNSCFLGCLNMSSIYHSQLTNFITSLYEKGLEPDLRRFINTASLQIIPIIELDLDLTDDELYQRASALIKSNLGLDYSQGIGSNTVGQETTFSGLSQEQDKKQGPSENSGQQSATLPKFAPDVFHKAAAAKKGKQPQIEPPLPVEGESYHDQVDEHDMGCSSGHTWTQRTTSSDIPTDTQPQDTCYSTTFARRHPIFSGQPRARVAEIESASDSDDDCMSNTRRNRHG